MQFSDEWLVPTVRALVSDAAIESLRKTLTSDGSVSLWETLLARRMATDDQILKEVGERFHLPLANLSVLDPRVREVVPEQLARRFNIVPVRITDSHLEVACANPFDIEAEKMLAFATGRDVRLSVSSPRRIREKLDELYRPQDVVSRILGGMDQGAEVTQLPDLPDDLGVSADDANERPIVRLVDMLLADGIASRASDIHIEPSEGAVVVRYRIDGVLRQVMKIPRMAGLPLISRIKIMSGLDIADRLRPQDGRARVAVNGSPVDLRVSTLPASLGEKVVIRILDAKATILELEALGMMPDEREQIQRLLQSKEGIVLVTGPTGSGKTTTLYAAIRSIQSEGVNIVTVEDPVEYRLGSNIVQVQVHDKAGLTFASALRSILRQDPDVVLVGEIRDLETAEIALQASLTGHLVLSTLHTNDAPNSVTRLVDIGLESYKIAAALRGVIAQRLMRRLCPVCAEPRTEPVPPELARFVPAGARLLQAVGCGECAMTGYRGRFSICEIFTMNQELERLVALGATADQLTVAARAGGMQTLFESGMRHVLAGESTLEELLRVTEPTALDAPARGGAAVAPPVPPAAPVVARAAVMEPPATAPDLGDALELLEEGPGDALTDGRRGTVLLVEDEDQLRRVMKDLLEREGYRVGEARNGIEALDQVDRFGPDVVILDLNLPGVDGYTVLSKMRSHPSTARIPVIVLTAKGDEDNEVRVFELGADDFLTKPFRARALSARLDALLARRRA
ncbi:MAG: ATPase, T2SS/T4P/T4SS family [Gemmatimonadota bacterium]